MPNPNISATLNPADKTTMKTNVDANKVFLTPFGVNLTPQDRKDLSKLGSESVSYGLDSLQVAKDYPQTVPGDMNVNEFEKDVNLFNDMNELEIHHASYIETIADTKIAVGAEVKKQADRIYNNVKELAKNNSNFQTIAEQLGKRYDKLRGPKPRTSNQEVALGPNSSVSLMKVVPGSSLKNTGTTNLMVCEGVLPGCISGTVVTPNFSITLPNTATSITITNQSASLNGTFTVKTLS